MNDNSSFERFVADQFARESGDRRSAEALHDDILTSARHMRQRPEWLALIKEPPMRFSSGLAVGSPTARVAAVMVATLLITIMVSGAGIAGARLLAADGAIIVDQSGDGSVTTITAGVAMTGDGDTILVRPGTYTESVIVDKDIALTGDGPREDIVIRAPDDGPTTEVNGLLGPFDVGYAALLVDSRAELSGLTFMGDGSAVVARGGSPRLHDLTLDGAIIAIIGGSSATLHRNDVVHQGTILILDGSDPVVAHNVLEGGSVSGNPGLEAVIRDNTITGGISIGGPEPTNVLIEGNTIDAAGHTGIWVGEGQDGVIEPIIRRNSISGGLVGIEVFAGAMPTIEDNELSANTDGIVLSGSDALVVANRIHDNGTGIRLGTNGAPTISGHTIGSEATGLAFGGAPAVLSGNTICENTRNVFVGPFAGHPDISDNEVCPDEALASSD